MTVKLFWEDMKWLLIKQLLRCAARSAVLEILELEVLGSELRIVVRFLTRTLAKRAAGPVMLHGSVDIMIQYRERFLDVRPSSGEVATVQRPTFVFHPNIGPGTGCVCMGWMPVGVNMDTLLHQLWGAIRYDERTVNAQLGDVLDPAAALFVQANEARFPLSQHGLFEAEPITDDRDVSLRVEDHWRLLDGIRSEDQIMDVHEFERQLRTRRRQAAVWA